MRLIPFVERNYNLIELGPKGTGKSHIFSEFSPHGILCVRGEVTVPKRVKDQLMRIDTTYPEVDFSFSRKGARRSGLRR
jgi:hypothetical protein